MEKNIAIFIFENENIGTYKKEVGQTENEFMVEVMRTKAFLMRELYHYYSNPIIDIIYKESL